jgi:mannose-6-phosphate isomerase-like protein (cupin superfamily)
MLIKKESSHKKQNTEDCTVWEYDFPNKNLGFAVSKINNRYPTEGKAVNTKCDILYYVISGSGIVHQESGNFEINEGDAFFFEKEKWYWIEGKNLTIALPSVPAWNVEQYKEII